MADTPLPPPPPAKATKPVDEGKRDRITRIFCAIVDGPNHPHFIAKAVELEQQISEAST